MIFHILVFFLNQKQFHPIFVLFVLRPFSRFNLLFDIGNGENKLPTVTYDVEL